MALLLFLEQLVRAPACGTKTITAPLKHANPTKRSDFTKHPTQSKQENPNQLRRAAAEGSPAVW